MPSRRGLLLAVLLAAGCGSTPVTEERPAILGKTAPTFGAEASSACAQLPRRLNRIRQTTSPASDQVWLELADAWEGAVRRLRKLDAPPAERARFRRMLRHFESAIRAARAVPAAEHDMALAPIAVLLDQGGKGATIAQSLGLLACSAVPPAPTEQELDRRQKHMLQAARRMIAQLQRQPRLNQAAHPRGVRPRVEAPPRP